ncbi:glutamate synthase [NADH], partial [Actinomortierella ambigua]
MTTSNVEMRTTDGKHAANYVVDPNNSSWACSIPSKQALYDPEYEKDSCGVGFIVDIQGRPSHKILSDAKQVLCNM